MYRTTAALLAAFAVPLALPVGSAGQASSVDDLTTGLSDALNTALPALIPATGLAPPRQSSPSAPGGYQPPLHGQSPHGQGTVAVVDLAPTGTRPLPGEPSGGFEQPEDSEELVVGRARGQIDEGGQYQGHITVVAVFGHDVGTGVGEAAMGLVQEIRNVLASVCSGSNGQLCVDVLQADSTTTSTGSSNKFKVAGASAFGLADATAAESNGDIAEDGSCQTTHGSSTVAATSFGGAPLASALSASTDSRSCADGSGSQASRSNVFELFGAGVALPVPGCANGTADSNFSIPVVADTVCNADDQNGAGEPTTQAAARYGVREALSAFPINLGGAPLLKATTAGSEARAEAPSVQAAGGRPSGSGGSGADRPRRHDTRGIGGAPDGGARPAAAAKIPDTGAPACSDGLDNDGDGAVDFPDDAECDSPDDTSEPANKALALTGANLLAFVLFGVLAIAVGLPLRDATRRREPKPSPP